MTTVRSWTPRCVRIWTIAMRTPTGGERARGDAPTRRGGVTGVCEHGGVARHGHEHVQVYLLALPRGFGAGEAGGQRHHEE